MNLAKTLALLALAIGCLVSLALAESLYHSDTEAFCNSKIKFSREGVQMCKYCCHSIDRQPGVDNYNNDKCKCIYTGSYPWGLQKRKAIKKMIEWVGPADPVTLPSVMREDDGRYD